MARDKSDVWNRDGLRDRLFGKGQEINVRYSQEFKKEYFSQDPDSDFVLKKSHSKLTLSSNKKFNHLEMRDLSGICSHIDRRQTKEKYEVTYNFNGHTNEFFIANSIVNEIMETNSGVKIKQDYSLPKPELHLEYSLEGEKNIEEKVVPATEELKSGLEVTKEFDYALPIRTLGGRIITGSASKLEGNTILYSNQPAGKNILLLSAKPFEYPINFNGSRISVKTRPSGEHQGVFMVTYSAEGDKIEAGQEILKEIVSQN